MGPIIASLCFNGKIIDAIFFPGVIANIISWDIIIKKNEKPVPKHFNSRNYSHSDMIITPFEELNKKDTTLLDV